MPMVRFTLDPDNLPELPPGAAERIAAKSDAELEAAALSDPDNPPINERQAQRIREIHALRRVRAKTGMTQDEFAAAIGAPVATLRNWEQGRTVPEPVVQKLYRMIERDPVAALRLLQAAE